MWEKHSGTNAELAIDAIALCGKLERERDAAVRIIEQIEERYIDGCNTYEDWKFMGDTARTFLSENAIGEARADSASPPHGKTL